MSATAGSLRQHAEAAPAAEAAAPPAPERVAAQLQRDPVVEAAEIAGRAKEAAARAQGLWQAVSLTVGLALLGAFVREGLARSGASVRDGLDRSTKNMSGEFKVYHSIASPFRN